jgi:hypothetical protein
MTGKTGMIADAHFHIDASNWAVLGRRDADYVCQAAGQRDRGGCGAAGVRLANGHATRCCRGQHGSFRNHSQDGTTVGSGSRIRDYGPLLAQAEVEIEAEHRHEGARRVEQGIVRGGGAAGDEGLMDFIEGGVSRRNEPGGKPPKPAPTAVRAANTAINQEEKDEILGEMSRFSNQAVNGAKLMLREMQPAEKPMQNASGVFGGESVRGEAENDSSPQNSRPPGAEKLAHEDSHQRRVREKRFLAAPADAFAGAKRQGKTPACSARNDCFEIRERIIRVYSMR